MSASTHITKCKLFSDPFENVVEARAVNCELPRERSLAYPEFRSDHLRLCRTLWQKLYDPALHLVHEANIARPVLLECVVAMGLQNFAKPVIRGRDRYRHVAGLEHKLDRAPQEADLASQTA